MIISIKRLKAKKRSILPRVLIQLHMFHRKLRGKKGLLFQETNRQFPYIYIMTAWNSEEEMKRSLPRKKKLELEKSISDLIEETNEIEYESIKIPRWYDVFSVIFFKRAGLH